MSGPVLPASTPAVLPPRVSPGRTTGSAPASAVLRTERDRLASRVQGVSRAPHRLDGLLAAGRRGGQRVPGRGGCRAPAGVQPSV
ncbi:hypothetical protein, partial [Streptomyces sp. SID1143]|uniref:hypothetical protein n=1 Tax=Streptomyces sp. SID1143 TaxID=3425889 RepID=UPI00405670EB